MDRDQYTDADYTKPHVPPATSPMIDGHASRVDAAELANDNGDSDYPGTREASVDRGEEDADIAPGDVPDEIPPDQGDTIEPVIPDEVAPGKGGDSDNPGRVPGETPPPPD